ncbi:hypothetical protein [Algivirga pacifica]|uniref:Peptidase M56 domain-containing protein n=1 Tax=Algivirga pacifica TaxID=1162670 RepID=A0ABP9D9U4_9BACT
MPIVIVSKRFCNLWGILGITLYPFIIVRDKKIKADPVIMNHEYIHIRQQRELLVIPFYVLYLLNYYYNLWKYRNRYEAYRNICFEREAYEQEKDLSYLSRRPFAAFRTYL